MPGRPDRKKTHYHTELINLQMLVYISQNWHGSWKANGDFLPIRFHRTHAPLHRTGPGNVTGASSGKPEAKPKRCSELGAAVLAMAGLTAGSLRALNENALAGDHLGGPELFPYVHRPVDSPGAQRQHRPARDGLDG